MATMDAAPIATRLRLRRRGRNYMSGPADRQSIRLYSSANFGAEEGGPGALYSPHTCFETETPAQVVSLPVEHPTTEPAKVDTAVCAEDVVAPVHLLDADFALRAGLCRHQPQSGSKRLAHRLLVRSAQLVPVGLKTAYCTYLAVALFASRSAVVLLCKYWCPTLIVAAEHDVLPVHILTSVAVVT